MWKNKAGQARATYLSLKSLLFWPGNKKKCTRSRSPRPKPWSLLWIDHIRRDLSKLIRQWQPRLLWWHRQMLWNDWISMGFLCHIPLPSLGSDEASLSTEARRVFTRLSIIRHWGWGHRKPLTAALITTNLKLGIFLSIIICGSERRVWATKAKLQGSSRYRLGLCSFWLLGHRICYREDKAHLSVTSYVKIRKQNFSNS